MSKNLTEKTLNLLEYRQIMEKVASHANSEEAASIIKQSTPVYETNTIEEIKKKVHDILTLKKNGSCSSKVFPSASSYVNTNAPFKNPGLNGVNVNS